MRPIRTGVPTPKFLYFDLGNVLLHFDHWRGCRQMGEVAGVDAQTVWNVVFESGLEWQYEAGAISSQEFYEHFCRQTGRRPNFAELAKAASDIFELNVSMMPVLAHLKRAGYRLGLLSNTNEMHWNWFSDGRYVLIPEVFEQVVLSFRARSAKPEAEIFRQAAEAAAAEPREIFYIDDVAGHIAAAKSLGFDALQYTSTSALVVELRNRGLRIDY